MYIFCLPSALSLNDLEKDKKIITKLKSPTELRQSVKIAVIDDQPFSPEHNLKNNQFQIATYTDIHKIEQVSEYPIILCDLQGVGAHLSSDMQGAYLIEEIKRNYPEKIVIAYTGGSSNSNISKRASIAADDYLRKDIPIEDWRETLDKHIKNLSDPLYVWRKFRARLIHADITPLELLKLEDAFVRNIKSGAKATKLALKNATKSSPSNSLINKELISFVASKTFDLVFEALSN